MLVTAARKSLPSEVVSAHALILCRTSGAAVAGAARGGRSPTHQACAARAEALSQVDRLQHLLRQLQRMHFGRRSEKLDPDQFALALEDVEQAVAASEAADDKQNGERARARAESAAPSAARLPAHLPRVHVTIAAPQSCPCCRSPML